MNWAALSFLVSVFINAGGWLIFIGTLKADVKNIKERLERIENFVDKNTEVKVTAFAARR